VTKLAMGQRQTILPRWRGFNLLGLFCCNSDGQFPEEDFKWMRDWGFDFVRIPMSYRQWIDGEDPFAINEKKLERIDRVVALGGGYGFHVSLNFHRAPGYTVNGEPPKEPFILWKDARAQEAFCLHWETLAGRYRGVDNTKLSFDLVNEPPADSDEIGWNTGMVRADHRRVIGAATAAIRAIDPNRLILADGMHWGAKPSPELFDLGIAQSCRAYAPMGLAQYRMISSTKYCRDWLHRDDWPAPSWPGAIQWGERWDRAKLEAYYAQWADLAGRGIGVHCGEGGVFNQTPHAMSLAWLRDVLEILTGLGIGYAIWNLRGPFGILDSGRMDVAYENWHGHQLDRQMLSLLQEF